MLLAVATATFVIVLSVVGGAAAFGVSVGDGAHAVMMLTIKIGIIVRNQVFVLKPGFFPSFIQMFFMCKFTIRLYS